jgi:hypothetical protein
MASRFSGSLIALSVDCDLDFGAGQAGHSLTVRIIKGDADFDDASINIVNRIIGEDVPAADKPTDLNDGAM